jgi:hypothetical protein
MKAEWADEREVPDSESDDKFDGDSSLFERLGRKVRWALQRFEDGKLRSFRFSTLHLICRNVKLLTP